MTIIEELHRDIALDIEERTNQLWAYVREQRHSLNSERGCRMIREAIENAIESMAESISPLVMERDEAKAELQSIRRELRAAVDKAEKQNLRSQATITRLTKELAKMSDKAIEVNCADDNQNRSKKRIR